MTGCSFLFHGDKQGVLITVSLDAFDMLEMTRCGSLMPKLISRTAPVMHLFGL
ncbi:hypothetical protein HMPREF3219_0202041 [Streptococcus salivarius]|nr:hypothetical protein HMPREF3219_0202041 [Streptococcus salivarius]